MKKPIDEILREHINPYLERFRTDRGILMNAGLQVSEACLEAWLGLPERLRSEVWKTIRGRLEFVLVSTPGSGTSWMTNLLSALGKPAGHEGVFRPTGVLRIIQLQELRIVCDVSGFAIQWTRLWDRRLRIWHLVRHPADMANSCAKHLGWPAERAWNYWLSVHRRCDPGQVLRVEDSLGWVTRVTGRSYEEVEFEASRAERNAHPGRPVVTWGELPLEVRELGRRLGYTAEGIVAPRGRGFGGRTETPGGY